MATNEDNPKPKPIMDVARPGKSAPSATSKPVIVGHGPMMQDPMVNTSDPEENPEAKKEELKKAETAKKVIAPSEEVEQDIKAAEKEEKDKSSKEVETKENSADNLSDDVDTGDNAVVDAVAEQVGNKKKEEQESEEEKKQRENIDKLVEEKKYFLPIGRAKHRRVAKRVLFLVFPILLIFILVFALAADAGIIASPVKLPFDLIKNDKDKNTLETTNDSNKAALSTDESAPSNQPQSTSDTNRAKDIERETDIKAIHGQLEAYFAQKGARYPSFDELNYADFRKAELPGLTDSDLTTPEGNEAKLKTEADSNYYGYVATTADGKACDNDQNDCLKYTLTARLSNGTFYQKTSLN